MTKTTGSIAASTNIVKESVVMGDVSIGADSTILFYAVLRGDDNKIIIGKGTNIQDNCTVHTSKVDPTIVGSFSICIKLILTLINAKVIISLLSDRKSTRLNSSHL